MSLHIFVDPLQGAVFLICILTIPICTAATVLRFTNTRRSGRKVNLEDWFALVALLSFWLHAALSLWSKHEPETRSTIFYVLTEEI